MNIDVTDDDGSSDRHDEIIEEIKARYREAGIDPDQTEHLAEHIEQVARMLEMCERTNLRLDQPPERGESLIDE